DRVLNLQVARDPGGGQGYVNAVAARAVALEAGDDAVLDMQRLAADEADAVEARPRAVNRDVSEGDDDGVGGAAGRVVDVDAVGARGQYRGQRALTLNRYGLGDGD